MCQSHGPRLKILTLTYTEHASGAGIAAMRLHRAMCVAGIDSTFAVVAKRSQFVDVKSLGSRWTFPACAARQFVSKQLLRLTGAAKGETLSINFLPSRLDRVINRLAPDIVHLHWVGAEMIRVEEIARIAAPIVWTLHDEWVNIGVEHYRPLSDVRLDALPPPRRSVLFRWLDAWTRRRKLRCWQLSKPSFVAPSRWLAAATQQVLPEGLREVRTIPNPLPLDVFRPVAMAEARVKLGLPPEGRLIAFGALNSTGDARKGYALLQLALKQLALNPEMRGTSLLLFGNQRTQEDCIEGLPCYPLGTTEDPHRLAMFYSASDVFVCPSLQENLPNTVAEALACGTPCVAFAIGGLPDMIDHGENGYLARPFDPTDLAAGVEAVLQMSNASRSFARAKAEAMFSGDSVVASYLELYRKILADSTTEIMSSVEQASGQQPPRSKATIRLSFDIEAT